MKHEISKTDAVKYLETLLWTATLEDGSQAEEVIDVSDFEDGLFEEAERELKCFQTACLDSLGFDPFTLFDAARVAYDFALSRNGHGAGFFDGDYLIASQCGSLGLTKLGVSDALQEQAKYCGTHDLMVWVENEGTEDEVVKVDTHS